MSFYVIMLNVELLKNYMWRVKPWLNDGNRAIVIGPPLSSECWRL